MAKRAGKAATNHHQSVMFPRPEPVVVRGRYPARRVNGKLHTDAKPGTDLCEILQRNHLQEVDRLNFAKRVNRMVNDYADILFEQYGEKPEHVSEADWSDIWRRIRCAELPPAAFPVAHDALRAMRTIDKIVNRMQGGLKAEDVTELFCECITLGQLSQRMSDMRFEPHVAEAMAHRAGRKKRTERQKDSANGRQQAVYHAWLRLLKENPKLKDAAAVRKLAEAEGGRLGKAETIKKDLQKFRREERGSA